MDAVPVFIRIHSCSFVVKAVPRLDPSVESEEDNGVRFWGRTGFDLIDTPEAACRGRCVGLVNHRIKKQLTKN